MKLCTILFASFTATLIGCATVGQESSHGTPTSALIVEVPSAPPTEMRAEVKPPAPAPGYIWVAGYWDYIGGHHVWRDGRWLKGMPGYEYVRARYEWDGKSWQFHVPHWKRRSPVEATNVASRSSDAAR